MRYDDRIKEEARALYLQGLGYKSVSNKIREQYKNSLGYNTVKRWAKKDNWKDLLDDQRKAIRQSTAISSTQSVLQHIKTLRAVQNKFVSQLESDHYEIRVTEMVNVIRLMIEQALIMGNVT